MIRPQTLKGFRDFLPLEARKRQYVINILKQVFELYGFEPLETPVLEYEEVLTGKYGDEGDKLMYRFEDHGQRRVAMRYDQTVPLARVVAQYQNELAFPFKRYQISPVWRAENTQKGRYRELVQCDIDSTGADTALADAEIIAAAVRAYKKLGLKNIKIMLNDRVVFSKEYIKTSFEIHSNILPGVIRTIDKLKKIGEEGVLRELAQKNNFNDEQCREILNNIKAIEETERLKEIMYLLKEFGIDRSFVEFSPTLARGMDYYTGIIFEVETEDYPYGSLGGGGRFNNLIGLFADKQIPAVGFALGFDRTLEAMEELNLFPADLAKSSTKVLVTIFSEKLRHRSIELSSLFRSKNINSEVYLGEIKDKNPLEKQLKYADQKRIQYTAIIGEDEAADNSVTIKDMLTREQKRLKFDEAVEMLLS